MKYFCSECGSDNVSYKTWVHVNNDSIDDPYRDTDCFCNDCQTHQDFEDLEHAYTSEEILSMDDLYELQDRLSSGLAVNYMMTKGEKGWLNMVKGRYCIADWVGKYSSGTYCLSFEDIEGLKNALIDDGIENKAVMLSDDTALNRLFFWLS